MSEPGFGEHSFSERRYELAHSSVWDEVIELSQTIIENFSTHEIKAGDGGEITRASWQDEASGRTVDLMYRELDCQSNYWLYVQPLTYEQKQEQYFYRDTGQVLYEMGDKNKYVSSKTQAATKRKVNGYLKSSGVTTERMIRERSVVDELFAAMQQHYEAS